MPTKAEFSILHDEELMFHICNGEVRAFDELYARYGKRLLAYFTRMLNYNTAHAEDALQDVFLKIAEEPDRFDRSRSFKTWIFTLASNICKNYYRHKQVRSGAEDELIYNSGLEGADAFVNIARRMDGAAFRKVLDETLASLSPEKREAFILKYQEHKTIGDIAYIQGCPEGSVKSRLFYTIKILEQKLKMFNPILI
jgi:RNA polymerase sigma-70 factor, ECF subfamily